MKKMIILFLVLSIMSININLNDNIKVYANNSLNTLKNVENEYVTQLESISEQLYILNSNALKAVINKGDKSSMLKDASYIKSQIKSLRKDLSQYHQTESGDIEKNPISLALLNTLNYYSMSLSFLTGFLTSDCESTQSKLLGEYYFSKAKGDETLLWTKSQIK
ncbi:hypothetical protein [Romboutsia lituseburensis]|uniref:hypothetical protein n=1 Tax=Romboutsia lituseburensis TaxID=1537 RepID=UPI00215B1165|nr:hypothetical protein [Romboutsia lituseburensis]MCR8747030.1 hypothetical protein [Romboutsia lituseburensis]